MSPLILITLVVLFSALSVLVLWLHHLWAHRDRTAEAAFRRVLLINAAQIALCGLFGLAIGSIFFLGYCADYCP